MKRGAVLAVVGLTLAAAPAAEATAVASALSLVVDISDRKLYVKKSGEVIRSYNVAVGKSKHPTPRGSFRIRHIVWNPSWNPPDAKWAEDKQPREPGDPKNPMGRAKLFFSEPDYYIHGTRETWSLGKAASHGCVRMSNRDVMALARLVMEHGGAKRSPGWFRSVINRVRSTKEVWLSDPVPITVRS